MSASNNEENKTLPFPFRCFNYVIGLAEAASLSWSMFRMAIIDSFGVWGRALTGKAPYDYIEERMSEGEAILDNLDLYEFEFAGNMQQRKETSTK